MKVKITINDKSELNLYKVGDTGTLIDSYRHSKLVTLDKKWQGTKISYEFLNNEVEMIH